MRRVTAFALTVAVVAWSACDRAPTGEAPAVETPLVTGMVGARSSGCFDSLDLRNPGTIEFNRVPFSPERFKPVSRDLWHDLLIKMMNSEQYGEMIFQTMPVSLYQIPIGDHFVSFDAKYLEPVLERTRELIVVGGKPLRGEMSEMSFFWNDERQEVVDNASEGVVTAGPDSVIALDADGNFIAAGGCFADEINMVANSKPNEFRAASTDGIALFKLVQEGVEDKRAKKVQEARRKEWVEAEPFARQYYPEYAEFTTTKLSWVNIEFPGVTTLDFRPTDTLCLTTSEAIVGGVKNALDPQRLELSTTAAIPLQSWLVYAPINVPIEVRAVNKPTPDNKFTESGRVGPGDIAGGRVVATIIVDENLKTRRIDQ